MKGKFCNSDVNCYLKIKIKLNLDVNILRSGLPRGLSGKESTYQAEDTYLIPGLERSPGEGNDYLLQ